MNITKTVVKAGQKFEKHLPKILGGFALVFGVGAVVSTVKSTRKVDKHLEEFEQRTESGETISTKEYISVIGADVLPTVVLLSGSVICGAGCIYTFNSKVKRLNATVCGLLSEATAMKYAIDKKYGEGTYAQLQRPVQVEETVNEEGETVHKVSSLDLPKNMEHYHGFWAMDSKYYIPDDVEKTKDILDGINTKLTEYIKKCEEVRVPMDYVLSKFKVTTLKCDRSVTKTLGWNAKEWGEGVVFTPLPTGEMNSDGGLMYELRCEWPQAYELDNN